MDELTGDEFIVEDDGRRPMLYCAFFVPPSEDSPLFISPAFADARLLFRRKLCRKEGIAAMLVWLWDTRRNYELIGVTSGSR